MQIEVGQKVRVRTRFVTPGDHDAIVLGWQEYDLAKGWNVRLENGKELFICVEERGSKKEPWRHVL